MMGMVQGVHCGTVWTPSSAFMSEPILTFSGPSSLRLEHLFCLCASEKTLAIVWPVMDIGVLKNAADGTGQAERHENIEPTRLANHDARPSHYTREGGAMFGFALQSSTAEAARPALQTECNRAVQQAYMECKRTQVLHE